MRQISEILKKYSYFDIDNLIFKRHSDKFLQIYHSKSDAGLERNINNVKLRRIQNGTLHKTSPT